MECGEITVSEVHKTHEAPEVHDNPKDKDNDDNDRRRRRLQQKVERIVSVLENGRRNGRRFKMQDRDEECNGA